MEWLYLSGSENGICFSIHIISAIFSMCVDLHPTFLHAFYMKRCHSNSFPLFWHLELIQFSRFRQATINERNQKHGVQCAVCVCVFVCDSMQVLTDVILRIKWICMQIASNTHSNNQIHLSALPHLLIQHYLIQITLDYENLWNIKSAKTVLYISFSYCIRFYVNAYPRDRRWNGRNTKSKEIVGITTTVLSCWVVSIFNYENHLNFQQNHRYSFDSLLKDTQYN